MNLSSFVSSKHHSAIEEEKRPSKVRLEEEPKRILPGDVLDRVVQKMGVRERKIHAGIM
jgi:hypothetical protein